MFPEFGTEDERAHYLYYCYATDGTLLYVGRSSNPRNRLAHHDNLSTSPWFFAYCARAEIVGPMSKAEAIASEAAAIRGLRPVYNRQHNVAPRSWVPVLRQGPVVVVGPLDAPTERVAA